jgi:hypothetical protein
VRERAAIPRWPRWYCARILQHHGPHDDEVLTYATGTVAAITAVYQSYDDRGRLVEGSAYAKDCGSAVKFENEEVNGRRFRGYLIHLETPWFDRSARLTNRCSAARVFVNVPRRGGSQDCRSR